MSPIKIIKSTFEKYPLIRGMVTYSMLYPASNLTEQVILGDGTIDWAQARKFCIFGSLWVAPTIYCWIRVAGKLFPAQTIVSSLKKVVVEQFTYTPMALTTFYGGMTLLEGKSFDNAKEEVKKKFFPTLKIGIVFWPLIQTVNFTFVPEKNRVPVVATASFFWCTFLSYMKRKKMED